MHERPKTLSEELTDKSIAAAISAIGTL